MYIHAPCPHCGRDIQKISIFVIKPGLIACPGCKKISLVTGMGAGTLAYLFTWFAIFLILWPFKNDLNDSWVTLLIFGGVFIFAVYLMSLFLHLKK
jgi:hypothetical protein